MRKTSLVTVQGKKMMSYAELIVLSDSQHKKLVLYEMGERLTGLEELRKGIDNLAKDLHVNWSIESNGNVHIICIERTTTDPIDDAKYHDLEIAATNFMSAIDKMELPKEKDEPECPSHEPDKVNCDEEEKAQDAETLKFVKKLLNDMNLPLDDGRHVRGALIIDTTTHPIFAEPTCWGNMSYDLLKEMCELYIKTHENDQ